MIVGRPEVLIVEDDSNYSHVLKAILEKKLNCCVTVEDNGDNAAPRILAERPELVILDVFLPGRSGLDICNTVRPAYTGSILMVTGHQGKDLHLESMARGADDFLEKGASLDVILAHVGALVRRERRWPKEPCAIDDGTLGFEGLVLHRKNVQASVRGTLINLSRAEFELLWVLVQHAGEVVDRDVIYHSMTGLIRNKTNRSVDNIISRLRRILDQAGGPCIVTAHGFGYQLTAKDS